LKERRPNQVVVSPGIDPGVRGGLDKDIVRRVIRSNLNQIRFCYEKELIKTPQLNGRLAVQFVIAGTGVVSTAVIKDSTLGSSGVESCVTQAVRRWSFPQGRSAGMTMVTYPFVFAPAGS
jgi:TonB family protein